jgi:purine-binding chemotaxis protein CheW
MEENRILNKKVTKDEENLRKANILFQGIAFFLEENIYMLDVMYIRSIITVKKIFRVPNTNERLLGVLNLRGAILPVYSIKLILDLDDPFRNRNVITDDEKFIIIVNKDKDTFGIMIDSIYKKIIATDDNYREGKFLKQWAKNSIFSGVVLEEEKEIMVVNIDNLLKYMISLK